MSTIRSYLDTPLSLSGMGTIIHAGHDERGFFIVLNRTYFYPQGGGQPSDQGFLMIEGEHIPVSHVRCVADDVRHYTGLNAQHHVGKEAQQHINIATRTTHTKLHSAGHLISNLVEKLYPGWRATKGHHFPGQCHVEFTNEGMLNTPMGVDILNHAILKAIEDNTPIESIWMTAHEFGALYCDLPYNTPSSQRLRLIKIGDFPAQPCGGTHVKSTGDLKGLCVTKIKKKNTNVKISYNVNEQEYQNATH